MPWIWIAALLGLFAVAGGVALAPKRLEKDELVDAEISAALQTERDPAALREMAHELDLAGWDAADMLNARAWAIEHEYMREAVAYAPALGGAKAVTAEQAISQAAYQALGGT